MDNLTISILGNQIFSEIIGELKLFSRFKIKFYEDLDSYAKDITQSEQLIIFFLTSANQKDYEKVGRYDFPLIIISKFPITQNELPHRFAEQSIIPFSILDLEKKIISLLARYKFKKSSLIHLCGYTLNKNEKKIEKNNLKLQLTEKEIDCLILFSQIDKPLSRSFILKNIWKYSPESDTHTVETHIYRLRKKILEKFDDNNFIKNNNKGYYI
jgi:DNA-binding CsgD family transcriptional regulator